MLSRLRKIESLTIKITEEMPIHFDYETDSLYLKGIEKGIEKRREEERKERVLSFWKKGIDSSMISNLLDLRIEQVEAFITEFQNKKNTET